jgi:hypothetical protein
VRAVPNDVLAKAEVTTPVCAHVLDIELSEPVAGLEKISADGRCADRVWVLARLIGEPLGLDVLEIPAAGLSGEAVLERIFQALPEGQPAGTRGHQDRVKRSA